MLRKLNSSYVPSLSLLAIAFICLFTVPPYKTHRLFEGRRNRKAVNIDAQQAAIQAHAADKRSTSYLSRMAKIQGSLDRKFPSSMAAYLHWVSRDDLSKLEVERFSVYSHRGGGEAEQLRERSQSAGRIPWVDLVALYPELAKAVDLLENDNDSCGGYQFRCKNYPVEGYRFKHLGIDYHVAFRPITSSQNRAVMIITDLTESARVDVLVNWLIWVGTVSVVAVVSIGTFFQTSRPIDKLRRQIQAKERIDISRFSAREVQQLGQAFRVAIEENNLKTTLFEVASVALMVVEIGKDDEEARIIQANTAATKMFRHEQLEGMHLNQLVPEEYHIFHRNNPGKFDADKGRYVGMLGYAQCPHAAKPSTVVGSARTVEAIDADGGRLQVILGVQPLADGPNDELRYAGSLLDVTAMKAQEAELRYQLGFLQTVADAASPDIIMWSKDLDHKFNFVNQALVDIAFKDDEHKPEDMLGKTSIGRGWWPDEQEKEKFWVDDNRVTSTGERIIDDEEMGVDEHGRIRTQRVYKVPDNPDNPTCAIGVAFNTTDLTEARREAEISAIEADRQRVLIQAVARSTGHDMRSGLIVANQALEFFEEMTREFSELSEDDKADYLEESTDYLEEGQKALAGLDGLIKGASSIYKMEGATTLKKDTARSIYELSKPLFYNENVRWLGFDIDDFVTLKIDANMISAKVINNFIRNGLKYNDKPDKSITVTYSQTPASAIITVQDNGIGIHPTKIKTLLDPTVMGIGARGTKKFDTTEDPGQGLGVFSAKLAIDIHGGQFNIESVESQGSAFIVKLPVLPE